MKLIIDKEYYIFHIGIQFKGKYKTFYSNEHCHYYSFIDVKMRSIDLDSKFGDLTYTTINFIHYVFTDIDTFYDIEEMRNNKIKAQQNMEQRSLDIILKR